MEKNILITILVLCISLLSCAQDNPLPGRKEKKEVARIFGAETDLIQISFQQAQPSVLSYQKEGDKVFVLQNEGAVNGFLLTSRAPGKFEYFNYSVIYSPDLSILNVTILVYRSTNGAGICSKGWLKQFIGYRGEDLTLGKDIDAVSGGTISANSLLGDLKRCYSLMTSMKKSGMLE